MHRTKRDLVGLAVASAILGPARMARAQADGAPRIRRIGILLAAPIDAELRRNPAGDANAHAFAIAMRELGWIGGSNIQLLWRSFELRNERLPRLMDEFARLPVDVLVVSGNPGARAARKHPSLPTVVAAAYHPDEYGIVQSLSRPGGMITGALLEPGRGINAKRIALLRQTLPTLKLMAYMAYLAFSDFPPRRP